MALSLAELIGAKTQAQIEDDLRARLVAEGFADPANWQPGSIPRTFLKAFAYVLATLHALVGDVARSGFLDLVTNSAWLTLLAKSRWNLDRIPASWALHSGTLNNATGSPMTITPGQLVMGVASGAMRFRSVNASNVTVPAHGSAPIVLKADIAGTAGNVAPTVIMAPALPGLTFAYGSIESRARDPEGDEALKTRCRDRWAARASGATRAYYAFHLLSSTFGDGSSIGVTRLGWLSPPGDGNFTVVAAGSDGPLSPTQVAAASAYINDVTRRAHTDTPIVVSAGEVHVVMALTVRLRAASNTPAYRAAAADAVRALAKSLEIGQTLDESAVTAAIYATVPGIMNINMTSPAADVVVSDTQVVTLDASAVESSGSWISV